LLRKWLEQQSLVCGALADWRSNSQRLEGVRREEKKKKRRRKSK